MTEDTDPWKRRHQQGGFQWRVGPRWEDRPVDPQGSHPARRQAMAHHPGAWVRDGTVQMIRHTRFRFCPRCGGTRVEDSGDKAMGCGDCGFLYYHNTASAVAVILESRGGVLLSRRNADPGKGLLDLPGGFVDYGESCESALRREIKEEIDLDLGDLTYFGSFPNTYRYRDVTYFTTDMVFIASIPEEIPMHFNHEIREIVLVRPESVNFDLMAFEATKRALRAYWKMPAGAESLGF